MLKIRLGAEDAIELLVVKVEGVHYALLDVALHSPFVLALALCVVGGCLGARVPLGIGVG